MGFFQQLWARITQGRKVFVPEMPEQVAIESAIEKIENAPGPSLEDKALFEQSVKDFQAAMYRRMEAIKKHLATLYAAQKRADRRAKRRAKRLAQRATRRAA